MNRVVVAAGLALAGVVSAWPAPAAETPKYGGTLTYMIPADAPPSFDGHRKRPTPPRTRLRRSTAC